MPDPGDVFYLPPDANEPKGKGDRPYVLLSRCRPDSELVTLAYGSTKNNDAVFGAEHVLVDPFATPYHGTGLTHPTYVYPSRLVTALPGDLRVPAGRLIDELPAIRASLARAIGLGTGVTREANVRGSNRRGRLVELSERAGTEWETSHALVITEPGYSRYGYLQTVVPLLGGSFEPYDLDIVLPGGAVRLGKRGVLAETYHTAILAVQSVSTLYLPDHIAGFLDLVIPGDIMAAVDGALVTHFGLHEHI